MRGKGLSVLRKCLPLLGLLVLSSPTARAQVVEYYHLDAVGNVRAITDVSGNVIERHEYLPFGEECLTPPCTPLQGTNTRKFTSKERDVETGLDYFGARYYGSRIGRFTTVDPVYTWKENLADPQRWNRYAYGRNNPLRYVDPDGRESMSVIYMSQNPSWGRKTPPLKQEAALWGGMLLSGLLSFGGLAAAEVAPALLVEGQIAVGTCGASPACQNTGRGLAEGLSGAPPGALGVAPTVQFGQQAISATFRHGEFAGQAIADVATGLKSGAISPNQLPLQTIVRGGATYTLNNRSLMALRMAGVAPTVVQDVTGMARYEAQLTQRLSEMGGKAGADFVPRIRGQQ